ncbi:MAG: hypothetical protein UIB61_05150 [Treponema sp.]|nr:hypothetical protein [Treponema sp.]
MAKKPTLKQMTTPLITDSVLNFLSYMPNPDDVANGTSASYETYRNMRKDPRIKSLLGKLKSAALNFPMFFNQDNAEDKVFEFIKDLKIFKICSKKIAECSLRLITVFQFQSLFGKSKTENTFQIILSLASQSDSILTITGNYFCLIQGKI